MQFRHASTLLSVSVMGLGGVMSSSVALAAGFALRNHTASGVGTSLASDTVNTTDASGLLSNPAIMGEFKGNNLSLNLNGTWANISAENSSASLAGVPRGGESRVSHVSDAKVIPSIFGIHQINEQHYFGWGFNVPFATNTDYKDTWAGRYHGTKTELTVYDISLNYAFKLDEMWTFGASVSYQQANGELAAAADLGAAVAGGVQRAAAAGQITAAQAGAFLNGIGAGVGRNDVYSTFDGDNTAVAWGLGVLFKPEPGIRVGLNYRARVEHDASGDMKFEDTAGSTSMKAGLAALAGSNPLAAGIQNSLRPYSNTSDAKLKLTLPSVASLGYAHDIADFTVYGNVTWTEWSTFDELTPKFNGTESKSVLDWKDSTYFAVGADYRIDPSWTFRYGIGFDQSVVGNDRRTPRTPDNDRTALAIGSTYKMDALTISAAYQKILMEDAKIEQSATLEGNAGRGSLTSTTKADPNIFIVSAGYGF